MNFTECPDCGWISDRPGDPIALVRDHKRRGCRPVTSQHPTERKRKAMSTPLHAVKEAPARPPARELTNHPSAKVRRAAEKVLAAGKALDEAWQADAAQAELRAKRDRLKRQLAAIEAELRGAKPSVDSKAIRAWAAANGIDCPANGKVPNAVVAAYEEANK